MKLIDQLRTAKNIARVARKQVALENLTLLVGEVDRVSKDISDEDVIRVLRKIKKSELELLKYSKESTYSPLLDTIEEWLTTPVTPEEIEDWITQNVDFSSLKNKMQAIGLVKEQFGPGIDGNVVKSIIQEKF